MHVCVCVCGVLTGPWWLLLHHSCGAVSTGGTILCGGDRPKLPGDLAGGAFVNPTVIAVRFQCHCVALHASTC